MATKNGKNGKAEKLAIDGGAPVIKGKLPGWPWFRESAIKAAMEPLRTGKVNYWTGKNGMAFEAAWAKYNGAKFCITTNTGTAALHTALSGLGVGPGDEVIVPSYTFIATTFSVVQAGAIPVFADVNLDDHCISVESIRSKITPRTKAIIPVHLYGNMADMPAIMALAKEHNLFVIEDCAQALGATLNGKKAGTFGHAGAFSFCQSKAFTTGGEGGAVITDNEDLAWECRSFRDHGYDVKARMHLFAQEAKLPYIHNRVGFNYRLTEVQSTLGLEQLKEFESWNLKNRRKNSEQLIKGLKGHPAIRFLPVHNERGIKNGFFVFPMTIHTDRVTAPLKKILEALTAEGVPNHPVFWPQCYKERAFTEHNGFGSKAKFPFRSQEYTNPESVKYDQVVCKNALAHQDATFITVIHPTLTSKHMDQILKGILKVLNAFTKPEYLGASAEGKSSRKLVGSKA